MNIGEEEGDRDVALQGEKYMSDSDDYQDQDSDELFGHNPMQGEHGIQTANTNQPPKSLVNKTTRTTTKNAPKNKH